MSILRMFIEVLLQALGVFERRHSSPAKHPFGLVAVLAKKTAWLFGLVAMFGMVTQLIGELATAYATAILLKRERQRDHLRSHAGFDEPLSIGNSTASFLACTISVPLMVTVFLFLLLRAIFVPLRSALYHVRAIVLRGPIRLTRLKGLRFGPISGNGLPVLLSELFGSHAAKYSMTVGEIL